MAQTIFGKLMAKLTSSGVDALKRKHSQLTSQRDKAKSALEQAKLALQQFLLEGDNDSSDPKAIAALQSKVDSAASLLASLDEALAEQARRVAKAEGDLNAEQQVAARKVASETITADTDKIEQQLEPWLSATRKLATDLEKFSGFRYEAGPISRYMNNAAHEIEIALSVTLPDLRAGAIAVLEGREPAPTAPAPVLKIVPPAPPPTETVFFLRASKWTDDKGKLHLIQKFTDATLPPSLAAHAIKVGAAVEWKSPLRKQNQGTWNGRPFHAEHCFALDAASETHDPVLHSAFTPVDSGPAYNITVPVQRAPMVAARDMPTKK